MRNTVDRAKYNHAREESQGYRQLYESACRMLANADERETHNLSLLEGMKEALSKSQDYNAFLEMSLARQG